MHVYNIIGYLYTEAKSGIISYTWFIYIYALTCTDIANNVKQSSSESADYIIPAEQYYTYWLI